MILDDDRQVISKDTLKAKQVGFVQQILDYTRDYVKQWNRNNQSPTWITHLVLEVYLYDDFLFSNVPYYFTYNIGTEPNEQEYETLYNTAYCLVVGSEFTELTIPKIP